MTRAKKFVRCACGQETGLRRWINEGWLRMVVHFYDGSRKFTFTCPTCRSRNVEQNTPAAVPASTGSDSRAMKYYLLQRGDDANTLHAFSTPAERDTATIKALFGEDLATQDEADAWDKYRDELNARGRLSFEGDPGLEWFTAWHAFPGSALELELRESFERAEDQLAAEKLSGNVVKEHYWRGELAAINRIRRAIQSPNASVSDGGTPFAPRPGSTS